MNSRVLALLLVALLAGATALIAAGATYDMDVQGAVDVPARTVTFQESEYTISAIGRADPGDDLTIQTTAPDGKDYRVYLYNSDKQIVADPKESGSSTLTINLDGLDPGSYMLTLYDGEHRAVHPVVIRGYTVETNGPTEATQGDEIDVSVDVTSSASSGQPAGVEIVIANSEETIRTTLTHQSDGHYTATVSLTGIDTGSYKLYAVAQGTEKVFGHTELLGISSAHSLSVDESTSGSSGGSQSGNQTTTAAPTTTAPTTSPTPTTQTEQTTAPNTTAPTPTINTPTQSPTPTDNVITPSSPGTSEATQTTPGQDEEPVLAILALILGCALYGKRII